MESARALGTGKETTVKLLNAPRTVKTEQLASTMLAFVPEDGQAISATELRATRTVKMAEPVLRRIPVIVQRVIPVTLTAKNHCVILTVVSAEFASTT